MSFKSKSGLGARKPEISEPTPEDPALQRTFRGHNGTLTSTSFSPDMKKLVSVSMDSTMMLWNFKPELRAYRYVGHEKGGVMSVEFSPNGKVIATAGKDCSIRLWAPTVKSKSTVIKGHSGIVRSVCFSADSKRLLSASDDKTLKLWSVTQQKFIFALKGHSNWVRSGDFAPDGRLVASGSDDKTVKIWDTKSMTIVHTFYDHTNNVNSVKFHPDGTCVAACSADKTIKLWDIRTHKLLQHYTAHQAAVNEISFHPSGNFLLSASDDGYMKVWDLREGHLFYTLAGHQGPVTTAGFSPEGDFFSSGGADGLVMVWETNFDKSLIHPVDGLHFQRNRDDTADDIVSSGRAQSRPFASNAAAPAQHTAGTTAAPKRPSSAAPVPARAGSVPSRAQSAAMSALPTPQPGNPHFSEPLFQSPPIQTDNIPPQIANSLEHIIRQIDILTRTVKIMEQRLTSTEENVQKLAAFQRQQAQRLDAQRSIVARHSQLLEESPIMMPPSSKLPQQPAPERQSAMPARQAAPVRLSPVQQPQTQSYGMVEDEEDEEEVAAANQYEQYEGGLGFEDGEETEGEQVDIDDEDMQTTLGQTMVQAATGAPSLRQIAETFDDNPFADES